MLRQNLLFRNSDIAEAKRKFWDDSLKVSVEVLEGIFKVCVHEALLHLDLGEDEVDVRECKVVANEILLGERFIDDFHALFVLRLDEGEFGS